MLDDVIGECRVFASAGASAAAAAAAATAAAMREPPDR